MYNGSTAFYVMLIVMMLALLIMFAVMARMMCWMKNEAKYLEQRCLLFQEDILDIKADIIMISDDMTKLKKANCSSSVNWDKQEEVDRNKKDEYQVSSATLHGITNDGFVVEESCCQAKS